MLWRWGLTIAGAMAMSASTAAVAKDYFLSPTANWTFEVKPQSCELWRSFGTGEDKVYAQFFRYEPSASFDLTLIGKPLGKADNEPVVDLRFGATGEPVRSVGMGGKGGADGSVPVLFLSGRIDNLDTSKANLGGLSKLPVDGLRQWDKVDPAVEAAATTLNIRVRNRSITLALGPMDLPMKVMRKCTADLVKGWGLDPVEQESLAVPALPKSNPDEWLRGADYPEWAAMWGHQAIVRFRLMVDDRGQVTDCQVQSAITNGPFAAMTCDLLRERASFEPARTADGRAVPSYFASKVLWVLQ